MEPEVLKKVLPYPIEPFTYKGKAFLSIVISDLHKMHPSFFPKFLGVTFNQIVYRAVVKVNDKKGVYFVRSDSDSVFMNFMGNLFSNFKLHKANINFENELFELDNFDFEKAKIRAKYILKDSKTLPKESIFETIDEATNHLVELFSAFSVRENKTFEVQIKRTEWEVCIVEDEIMEYEFMQKGTIFNSKSCKIDSIFYIENVDYHWMPQKRID
jgi:uncharacterized protein YqjF (DUF2071 family)